MKGSSNEIHIIGSGFQAFSTTATEVFIPRIKHFSQYIVHFVVDLNSCKIKANCDSRDFWIHYYKESKCCIIL